MYTFSMVGILFNAHLIHDIMAIHAVMYGRILKHRKPVRKTVITHVSNLARRQMYPLSVHAFNLIDMILVTSRT